MKVKHRGVVYDRFDTPFGLGALLWAEDCHYHCPGCFHQDRFDRPVYEEEHTSIVKNIKSNPFIQGIVFGGFEWTEQYEELLALIQESLSNELEVIVYTHCTLEEIRKNYTELLNFKGIYLKCGEYDESLLSNSYSSYGVPLASTNQIIYKVGKDI